MTGILAGLISSFKKAFMWSTPQRETGQVTRTATYASFIDPENNPEPPSSLI